MIAQFNMITGADWRHSLVSSRARIAQKRIATESFIRRASAATAARNNTLAVGLADGAQGDPATALDPTRTVVAHETKTPTAFTFPTMTGGTATQSEEMRKAVETPKAPRESL